MRNKRISRANERTWANYTPEQRAARQAAMLAGRRRGAAERAARQAEAVMKQADLWEAVRKPVPAELPATPVLRAKDLRAKRESGNGQETLEALELLQVIQLEMSQTLGFTPTLAQVVQHMEAKAKGGVK